jgi:hypothetical protein
MSSCAGCCSGWCLRGDPIEIAPYANGVTLQGDVAPYCRSRLEVSMDPTGLSPGILTHPEGEWLMRKPRQPRQNGRGRQGAGRGRGRRGPAG